jgi:hypothetical protein
VKDFLPSVGAQAPHKVDQALDLFLGEIRVRRHGGAFADGNPSALDHGPDPVIGSGFSPIRICEILRFFSQTSSGRSIPFPAPAVADKTSSLKKSLPIRLIALIKQTETTANGPRGGEWAKRRERRDHDRASWQIAWRRQAAGARESGSNGNQSQADRSYSN